MEVHSQDRLSVFLSYLIKHQYKMLCVSLLVGFLFIKLHYILIAFWFLSQLSVFFAVVAFLPALLVLLAHGREFGPFLWWDTSNIVLTTRRSRRVEKTELQLLAVLLAIVLGLVVFAIFLGSR